VSGPSCRECGFSLLTYSTHWDGQRSPARVHASGSKGDLIVKGKFSSGLKGGETMSTDAGKPGVPLPTMLVLMLAVFAVSVGYGVLLPLLPYLIERLLGAENSVALVARSTGLLTGTYMLALFVFAPIWGRVSDVYGRRIVLLAGLVGFGATMLVFSFNEKLTAIYAERLLSGMFAAAVTPVAQAVIGDLSRTEDDRAHRLTLLSLAGISGFLLGPMLSMLSARSVSDLLFLPASAGALAAPLIVTGVLVLAIAAAGAAIIPRTGSQSGVARQAKTVAGSNDWLLPQLLGLSFIVSASVGVFEVGLALRGKQELGLTPYQIGIMFSECSLIMFVVQAIVFSPWVKPETTRWLVAPALAVLAAGLFLVPRASDFAWMLAVIGAVSASAGILSPILTYWISRRAGVAQGAELGKQTAASSLGAAIGSAAGGLFFNVAALPAASFALVTGLAGLGFLVSLRLASRLAQPKSLVGGARLES
jgi:MFS family permease